MYKKIYQIWVDIVYFGVQWEMPDGLKKRIILSNLASITLATIFFLFNVIQTIFLQRYYITITTSVLILYLASVPLLNRAGFTSLTRRSLCLIMPVSLIFIVPYDQLTNPGLRDIAFFTVPRFTILAMLVLPATLLDYQNKVKMAAGLSIILICLLFLEEIQGLFVGSIDYGEYRNRRLFLIKFASVSAFIFLTSGFLFFRRVSQRFEQRISRLLNKEKTSNTDLQAANKKLEESNQKISDLLNKLKETNNNLVESKAELEEAYEELQSIELLTRERALEIEKQKEQIEESSKAIMEKNQLLADAQRKIAETNEELKASNSSLEEMVSERTARLRRTNENLIQANQELDLFIYRASHDLRGPIASILGLTKIAKIEEQKQAQMSYLEMLEKTADNANEVLSKLLLVNIVNQAAEHLDIDFEAIVKNLRRIFDKRLKELDIDFCVEVKEGMKLVSDANLLLIICERLIENAIDFRCNRLNEKPYLKLLITGNDNRVVFEFRDNGIGIASNFYQRIFGMFFRASERSQGNGLGLYIARKAAEKLGGEITFESEIDSGSSFRLILPVE